MEFSKQCQKFWTRKSMRIQSPPSASTPAPNRAQVTPAKINIFFVCNSISYTCWLFQAAAVAGPVRIFLSTASPPTISGAVLWRRLDSLVRPLVSSCPDQRASRGGALGIYRLPMETEAIPESSRIEANAGPLPNRTYDPLPL